MWSLENYESQQEVQDIVAKAISNPHDFVVKPQKEGGGNNFYDEEAKSLLQEFVSEKKESLKQFMVMERINPPMIKAWMLRDGQLIEIDSLSELGIYSCLFMDSEK